MKKRTKDLNNLITLDDNLVTCNILLTIKEKDAIYACVLMYIRTHLYTHVRSV